MPAYGGFSGRCLLPPDYAPPDLTPHLEPSRALVRACNTLMNLAVASATYEALKDEIEIATHLHRKLLKARRVGGWQLQHLLKEVRPRDLATRVIDKAKSLPPIPQQALDELQRVVKQFEVAP